MFEKHLQIWNNMFYICLVIKTLSVMNGIVKKGNANPQRNSRMVSQRMVTDFNHKIRVLAKQPWARILGLVLVCYLLFKQNFSFQLSIGQAPTQAVEPMAEPVQDLVVPQYSAMMATPSAEPQKPTEPQAVSAPSPVQQDMPKPSALKDVANVATPGGAGLTKAQRELAESISNLTFILNPGYAQRKNVDAKVIEHKMQKCRAYAAKYLKVAQAQARQHNIPVSITLAQGLLESNAGESLLAQRARNHFGIKCFSKSCKKGHCMNATDDSHKDFFRMFSSADMSFEARSQFLLKNRYKHLTKLKRSNYKAWAHGLKKAGYATDPNYAEKLIKIIEVLNLQYFDK